MQTAHTTTALLANEHEPLLLDDLRRLLERLAPREFAPIVKEARAGD